MKNLINYIKEYVNEGLKITKDTEIDELYDTPGVYAYFKDGYMADDESYIKKHKKNAIGVAVIAKVEGKLHRIVVDKTDVNSNTVHYGGYKKKIDGATIIPVDATAPKDMNGKANTVAISNACHGYDDDWRTGSAAEDCQARFGGKGYLPSLGEWKMLYDNKDNIDKMMSIISGTTIKSWYWSSTLYNASTHSWYFHWSDGNINRNNRSYGYYVRAVMEI